MSFLTEDAKNSLTSMLADVAEQEVPQASEPKVSTRAEETSIQRERDDKMSKVSSTKEDEETGHQVPYSRFKEVNESKKALKARTAELEAQLADMRTKIEKRETETRVRQEEPDVFSDFNSFYDSALEDASDPKLKTLEQRLQVFEQRAAEAELEAEINVIQKKYPDVPEQVLLQAVINRPDTNLIEVAREYSQFIAEIEERALAKHNVSKKAPPAAPRRPQSDGSSGYVPPAQPRTMADARNAALAYFKKNGL